MKVNCFGCRASDRVRSKATGKARAYTCGLGYVCSEDGKPEEECPKPRTWIALRALKSERAEVSE